MNIPITIVKILASFKIQSKVENILIGNRVSRYEIRISEGVRVKKIISLSQDLALGLQVEHVMITPLTNGLIAIDVPNIENNIVNFKSIFDSEKFQNHDSKLSFALGKNIIGQDIIGDICEMPHLLIAGATGSGKSVCMNSIISSIIKKQHYKDVKLLLIDPKVVELDVYNKIPHLIYPVISDCSKAIMSLEWAIKEMQDRYNIFVSENVRNIDEYNQKENTSNIPKIVIFIDELADLMMQNKKEIENAICRLSQLGRAAGIHLVVATQRPSTNIITGVIKANITSRLAFTVASHVDSKVILDSIGAEKLLGRGDSLFINSGAIKPIRVQCCYIAGNEIENITNDLKLEYGIQYNQNAIDFIEGRMQTIEEDYFIDVSQTNIIKDFIRFYYGCKRKPDFGIENLKLQNILNKIQNKGVDSLFEISNIKMDALEAIKILYSIEKYGFYPEGYFINNL